MALDWISGHWFDLLQTVSIVGGLYFAADTLRTDTKVRRMENHFTLSKHHREIWTEIYQRPDLSRILDLNAELKSEPVTRGEKLFVNFLIIHLNNSYEAIKNDLFPKSEGLSEDIKEFFSLPIPRAVWEQAKKFQDRDFVSFVETSLQPRDEIKSDPRGPLAFTM